MKKFIKTLLDKHFHSIFFILPLSVFSLMGWVLLYFAIKFPTNVPIYGWITILVFAILPLLIMYSTVFGISISEKQQKKIDDRRSSLTFDEKGITVEMPLFDKNCFMNWDTIDAIIYYDFHAINDFTEYQIGYKFYLNTLPVYTKYEKQWWLNRLFQKNSDIKIVDIKDDTKQFKKIPAMVEEYLKTKVCIAILEQPKRALVSSQTYQNKNKTTTVERWKPIESEPEEIVFDRYDRTLEEIKKSYL